MSIVERIRRWLLARTAGDHALTDAERRHVPENAIEQGAATWPGVFGETLHSGPPDDVSL